MSVNELRKIANSIGDKCSSISSVVLDDSKFAVWSGAHKPDAHHYGVGGLARHTLEVVELCLMTCNYFATQYEINKEKLFLAALFHDIGKTFDYIRLENGSFTSCEHKRLIHHITRSALIWSQAKNDFGYADDEDEVLHAILAHHGQRNWGSPIMPKSRIAWILHLCDCLSARANDCTMIDLGTLKNNE